MMDRVASAQIRRPVDRSHGRRPLRLQISRRVARNDTGNDEFVTQVRVGGAEAVFVPWDQDHRVQPSHA